MLWDHAERLTQRLIRCNSLWLYLFFDLELGVRHSSIQLSLFADRTLDDIFSFISELARDLLGFANDGTAFLTTPDIPKLGCAQCMPGRFSLTAS